MVRCDEIASITSQRKKELEKIIQEKTKALKQAPNGMLRVAKCKNTYQYFVRKDSTDRNGTYLRKHEFNRAAKLAQKEYDEKVILAAQRELSCLNKLSRVYETKDKPLDTALVRRMFENFLYE